MKKTLCVLLGLAAMATSFVSCGGGKGSANKDVNLNNFNFSFLLMYNRITMSKSLQIQIFELSKFLFFYYL